MTILIFGLILFFAIHLVPALPDFKQSLIERFGKMGYRGLFSILALIGLVMIVWGKGAAEYVDLYEPPKGGRHGTMALVLIAFILLASFKLKSRIRKTLRHPMLLAIALWGLGHLLANGDVASVVLFGSFIAYAIIAIVLANAQKPAPQFDVIPRHDLIAVIAGIAIYVVVLFAHPWLIGVPVV